MLKTTKSTKKLALKVFRAYNDKIVGGGDDRANETFVNLFKNEKSKNLMYIINIKATKKPNSLISNAKKIFNHLRLAFIKD